MTAERDFTTGTAGASSKSTSTISSSGEPPHIEGRLPRLFLVKPSLCGRATRVIQAWITTRRHKIRDRARQLSRHHGIPERQMAETFARYSAAELSLFDLERLVDADARIETMRSAAEAGLCATTLAGAHEALAAILSDAQRGI